MVPGLAGMAEMPYREFALYNALGGAVWGTTFGLLGYFAGQAWHTVARDASKIGLGLLILVLGGLIAARVVRSTREHDERVPDRIAGLRPVVQMRDRFPRLSAWLARRVDPGSPKGFVLSVTVVAGLICGWIFLGLLQDVLAHEEVVRSDPGVMRFVVGHRAAWVTTLTEGSPGSDRPRR